MLLFLTLTHHQHGRPDVTCKPAIRQRFLLLIHHTYFLTGLVKVNIVAEGEDDPKATGRTSIKVNGIERSPMMRGHNIVVLDSDRNFIMAANFDTADSTKGEGVKMAKFLQQLPQERIVLIGTQGTTGGYWFKHRAPTQATCVAVTFFFLGTPRVLQRNC